jgi:outer membrane protein assembly factor BamA
MRPVQAAAGAARVAVQPRAPALVLYIAVLGIALAAASAPAAAQTARLARLEVTGTERYAPEAVARAAGLEIGGEVTREALQAAADRLAALGLFRDVRYRFTSLGDNLTLTFELAEADLAPVWFDNFPWFTDEELHAALAAALPLYDRVAPEASAMLGEMAAVLEQQLAAQGIAARVTHELLARPGRAEMVQSFRVAGRELRVEGLEFGDAFAANHPRVREFARELVGRPYSRYSVEIFVYDHVRPIYHERGQLRAEFGRPLARFTGDPRQPLAEQVLVFVPITPGAVYRWAGVAWEGNTAFGPAPLDEFLAMREGMPADGLRLLAGWRRIENEYHRRGFLDFEMEAEPEFDEAAHTVRFRARLREGPQYRMGQLVITGLSLTAERLLVAAWRIPAGEYFDQVWFEEFLEKGVRPAFGSHVVNYETIGHLLRKNAEARTVDVLIDFK